MSAELIIGRSLETQQSAIINAHKLNRHTFWCGQSGSGKTYALGVLLEQVLLNTKLPLIVLDPNSDFVHLNETIDTDDQRVTEFQERSIRVLRPASETDRLCLKYPALDVRTQAALFRLDPIFDAEQFNTMLQAGTVDFSEIQEPITDWLRKQQNPSFTQLALRIENLGVLDWPIWAWGDADVNEVVAEKSDATVIDLGGFDSPDQLQLVALALLDYLWNSRHSREAKLVVIDEAHNLCPPNPSTPLEKLLTERIIQIAAEGRKYGLWLLLSTQRPSKIHPNVISQCDNLALMKMSSQRDLKELSQIFGYAPEELVQSSPDFAQGQALFCGGFTETPLLVQMGNRLTREGGSDVTVELR